MRLFTEIQDTLAFKTDLKLSRINIFQKLIFVLTFTPAIFKNLEPTFSIGINIQNTESLLSIVKWSMHFESSCVN